ncbi:glycosyltransferase family 2 protein [Providencia rustigianii]|uniref:glycosyltransferase family 2 protein n=1 Tax=Providencia rustigianii TaxID=158850 RepID=UPI0038B26E57
MQDLKPYISIIMPCYNSSLYIRETIESVLNQKYTNYELIIVDDCSTDNTVEIIQSYTDARIKLIPTSQNGGAGKARNLGLKNASFDFIAFIDADDIWDIEKLDYQVKFLLKNPDVDVVCTGYSFIDEYANPISGKVIPDSDITLDSYMRNTCIGCSTALINKKNKGDICFSEIRLRQDTHLWISLLIKNYNIKGISESLVQYRVRKNQISGNKINAAIKTFKLYWGFKEISAHKRIINYFFYAINGIAKRLK